MATNNGQPEEKPLATNAGGDPEGQEIKLQSSKPVSTQTAGERKRRYADLKERMGRSKLEVRGVEGRHYLWANKDMGDEMTRLDILGYKITREPNPRECLSGKRDPVVKAAGLREDGTYIVGDVILMDCDEEVFEFIQLEIAEKQDQLVRAAKDDFVSEASKSDVPTFEVTRSRR